MSDINHNILHHVKVSRWGRALCRVYLLCASFDFSALSPSLSHSGSRPFVAKFDIRLTQSTPCTIFTFNVGSHHTSLNYTGQELKQQQQQQNTRFAVYAFYRLVTLKQGQRNQTWYRSIDPKQGYHHVRFERLKAS